MVYIETTINDDIDPQNSNRCFEMFSDSNTEQTARILDAKAEDQDRDQNFLELQHQIWKCLQELLQPLPVYIPFAKYLAGKFPTRYVRARRDFPRCLALIEASALLHQANRRRIEINGIEYIEASKEDFYIAWDIFKPILSQTYKQMTPKEEKFKDLVKRIFRFGSFNDSDSTGGENVFGPKELRQAIKKLVEKEDETAKDFEKSRTQKEYLKKMTTKGLVEWNGKGGTESKYALISDVPETFLDFSLDQWSNRQNTAQDQLVTSDIDSDVSTTSNGSISRNSIGEGQMGQISDIEGDVRPNPLVSLDNIEVRHTDPEETNNFGEDATNTNKHSGTCDCDDCIKAFDSQKPADPWDDWGEA